MHYYQFNIGDYLSHTRHLSPIEDICYRRALDYYYLHENPLPLNVKNLARLLLLSEYEKQLEVVLDEFFDYTENGFINPRADKEIQQYQGFAEAGKRGAAKRWSKDADSPPISPPKQPPIANNKQEPINNKQIKTPSATKVACPAGVSLNIWNDFLTLRRSKKLPITETALAGIAREAELAGLSLQQTIITCCERGWGGFKADWLKAEAVAKEKESQAWRTDDVLMMQKARELGVNTTGKTRFEVVAAIDKKRGAV